MVAIRIGTRGDLGPMPHGPCPYTITTKAHLHVRRSRGSISIRTRPPMDYDVADGDVPRVVENGEADAAIVRLRSFSVLSKSAVV
jgi:hypothetical protein